MSLKDDNTVKFSDRLIWANSADPDQTAPNLIRVFTVHSQIRLEAQSDQGLHRLLIHLHLFQEIP